MSQVEFFSGNSTETSTTDSVIFGVADSGDEKGAGCLKLRFNSSCFSATHDF